QLSPGNPRFWRNLGHINLAVERLPDAEIAFDKALAVNADDADALCGTALIAQRQGRPKDADAIAKRIKSLNENCHGVSDGQTAAGVMQLTRMPVLASSLPIDLVSPMTPALEAL